MLWRLCSRIALLEDRKRTLFFLVRVYQNKECNPPSQEILRILEDYGFVTLKRPKGKPEINTKLKMFLDQWIKLGHLLEDLIEWYSEAVVRPAQFTPIDEKVTFLLEMIPDKQVREMIVRAYDIYSYELDSCTQGQMIIRKSWSMLENLIKAYCLETGFRDFYLILDEEALDKQASPLHRDRKSLMDKFKVALRKKQNRLKHFGLISSIKNLRNAIEHEKYIPKEREVTIGEKTYPLEDRVNGKFFYVIATQNPIEQEGTYPLPEAQLDRFMMRIIMKLSLIHI